MGWASGKGYGTKILKIRNEICSLGLAANAGSSTGISGSITHTVVHGDTLWAIAEKYLGDGSRYEEIKRLNGLSSNVIYSGQVLKISGAKRKQLLGALYDEVQARVNQKLGY